MCDPVGPKRDERFIARSARLPHGFLAHHLGFLGPPQQVKDDAQSQHRVGCSFSVSSLLEEVPALLIPGEGGGRIALLSGQLGGRGQRIGSRRRRRSGISLQRTLKPGPPLRDLGT